MTRQQIEQGQGRYVQGRTVIVQRGSEDVFDTERAGSGWTVRPGWHIAGNCDPDGPVEWVDLR